MPDSPIPPLTPGSPPPPAAPVDGLTPAFPAAAPVAPPVPAATPVELQLRRTKRGIIVAGAAVYAVFVLWSCFLLLTLPLPTGEGGSLVSVGLLTSLAGIVFIAAAGFFLLKRISGSTSSVAAKRRSLLKLIAVLLPGVLIGIATPLLIVREPSLPLDIISPTDTAAMVAPVAVTLSAERAAAVVRNLGFRPLKYQWDTDGDGKMNEETVLPVTTALYEREGVYTAVVRILLDGGDFRRSARRVVIPYEVFSVIPLQPVVEKPVKFSVASLLTDPKLLKEVQWDFGDGTPPVTATTPDIVHTYYAVETYPVSAIMQLTNQSQVTYKRDVDVREPAPLPFPITLMTEPKTLVGPVPFGVLFRLQTQEPLKEIAWSFGDGKEDRGASLLRASHVFDAAGIYPVTVRARSGSGEIAELTSIIRVTDVLTLRDLQFEGQPAVQNGRITGEAPLQFSLTPKTSTPLTQFEWEIPEDFEGQAQDATLSGVLRREGTYTITLMAQGAEGKSMRMPIVVEIGPPSAEATIMLTPDGGTAPLTVTFDASQTFIPPGETVAGFKWLFGDERQGTRNPELTGARVEHFYATAGEYEIQLSVVLTSGSEYTARRTIIVRKPTLSACITASRLTVQAGKGIEFDSSCSTGMPASLLWDVRRDDAPGVVQAQSSDVSYVHVFQEPGDYTITLTLKDDSGNQSRETVSISVTPSDAPEESPPEPGNP